VETAEMSLLRAVTGYRMTDHKRNDNIREEEGLTGTSIMTKVARTFGKNA
jgi:hypothetical protein